MRFRLGGWAVALVLVLTSCGVDKGSEHASPAGGAGAAELAAADLASARDTLPPAPPSTTTLTVLLTHAGDPGDPGLDAAAGALAQRPDIRVIIAVAGPAGDAETMSGFPVAVVDPTGPGLVAAAVAATGAQPDLVVVGIDRAADLASTEPVGAAAVAAGVPALIVGVEDGAVVDHAAAAMQLLEVLDLELDALLDEPAGVHRLTVPNCRSGSLRGRLDVHPAAGTSPLVGSDCTTADRTVPTDELSAIGAGYAALARLR